VQRVERIPVRFAQGDRHSRKQLAKAAPQDRQNRSLAGPMAQANGGAPGSPEREGVVMAHLARNDDILYSAHRPQR
jgi:hypothetical protein